MVNHSILGFFLNADAVVKIVMFILLIASIISWTIILQKAFFLGAMRKGMKKFEERFWSGADLSGLYNHLIDNAKQSLGLENIFRAGFKEFARLRQQGIIPDTVISGAERAMRIAQNKEIDKLEDNLPLLATIGSISPYIGLFGTVWGIMTSFQSLGSVQQASIAMVAPGISEALIATAMGLFAAIPAVIAYNRYANAVNRIVSNYDTFQDELTNILSRQAHTTAKAH